MTRERRSPPLLVIAGATATGKTRLSIRLAQWLRTHRIRAEIISADSRQVYRGMDIGTAKAPATDRAKVPHHGLDLVDPDQPFSVADFVAHAETALDAIDRAGGVAILAGGTGLYLRAVARGLDTRALPSDPALRARIEAGIDASGLGPAVARLAELAPSLAGRVDPANRRRVARALEIAELAGDKALPPPRGYPGPVAWVGLAVDRAALDRRIADRAAEQFSGGLLEEAAALLRRYPPDLRSFSAIGYPEAFGVLAGELTREAAVEAAARRTVAFAKRQRTWFRSEPGIDWIDATTDDPLPRALEVARRILDR